MTDRHAIAAILVVMLVLGILIAIWWIRRGRLSSRAIRRGRDYWAEESRHRAAEDAK